MEHEVNEWLPFHIVLQSWIFTLQDGHEVMRHGVEKLQNYVSQILDFMRIV